MAPLDGVSASKSLIEPNMSPSESAFAKGFLVLFGHKKNNTDMKLIATMQLNNSLRDLLRFS